MQTTGIWSIIIIFGAHILLGLIAFAFGKSIDESKQSEDLNDKTVFLIANYYPEDLAATSVILKGRKIFPIYRDNQLLLSQAVSNSERVTNSNVIFIWIGLLNNDFKNSTDSKTLIDSLPDSIQIFWLAQPPVDDNVAKDKSNVQIREFNQFARNLCNTRKNCIFIDPSALVVDKNGNLKPQFHTGDGSTLNELGLHLWNSAFESLLPAANS